MYRYRWIGVSLGLLIVSLAQAQTQLETDENTLKKEPLPIDAKGLLKFFEDQSMKAGDATRLALLVKRLDSDVYVVREPAARELIARGPISLPYLRGALTNSTLEMKRRAEECMAEIESRMKPEIIAAAARVLAARKDPRAAEVLLNFAPSVVSDPYLEEDLLGSIGRLTITPDKIDPLLMNALKDPLPFRRLSAAYLVSRRGGAGYRDEMRALLGDQDERIRERVAEGLFGKRPPQMLKEALIGDEALLKSEKIDTSPEGLVKFFANRTLSDEKQRRFRGLVKSLGSEAYVVRQQASKQLINEGPPVLAFLRDAEDDVNAERAARARECMDIIQENNKSSVPIAAAHLLARPQKKGSSPAEAIRTLLAYIPFADNDQVEEEILTCLTLLCLREPGIEPALVNAVEDANAMRRAAAAYVLGHVGAKDHVAKVQPLLDDLNPIVRLRAAQGMLAARDKVGLPSMISLVQNAPATYLPRVEENLRRIAADRGPSETIAASSAASRATAAKAWTKWLNDNQTKIDLTDVNDRESFLGLVTICEYDNQVGNPFGQIWETPRGGAKRWTFSGLQGAMDAHVLPNGRVLVAENSASRVTERDTKGEIKWQHPIPNPICCQRLPNGNTFIASYNMVMEIKPDKTEVYRYAPGPQFYIFSAHKAKNGNIVAITAQGQIIEMDSRNGVQKNVTQTQTLGNWCSVESMPNGNYLVASMNPNNGMIREIDRKGAEVWSKPFPGAFRATRLPNGNILAASMTTRQVVEMDRAGTIRWTVTCQGRPWGVHYR